MAQPFAFEVVSTLPRNAADTNLGGSHRSQRAGARLCDASSRVPTRFTAA